MEERPRQTARRRGVDDASDRHMGVNQLRRQLQHQRAATGQHEIAGGINSGGF